MGKLLFDESPLVIQPSLAAAIGLNEAIVLQQVHYWIQGGKSGKEIDGVRWIYNSLSDWQDQFPFWSESTIYRTLNNLEARNLLKTGNFNQRRGDRTKWYTLAYDEIHFLETGGDRNSLFHNETSSSQPETTIPETSPESTPVVETTTPANGEIPTDPPIHPAVEKIQHLIFGLGWKDIKEIRELAEKDVGLVSLTTALQELRGKVQGGEYRATWGTLKKFWASTLSTNLARAGAPVLTEIPEYQRNAVWQH